MVDRQTAFERLAQYISVAAQSSDGVTIRDCWRALATRAAVTVGHLPCVWLLSAVIAQLCVAALAVQRLTALLEAWSWACCCCC